MKRWKNEDLLFIAVDKRTGAVVRPSRLSGDEVKKRCKITHDILFGKAKGVEIEVEHGTTIIRIHDRPVSPKWADALFRYYRIHATARQAYLAMMSDFRQGRAIPDVGTWKDLWIAEKPGQPVPPFCPPGWTPHGASYPAIMAEFRKLPRVQLHRAMEARKNKEDR